MKSLITLLMLISTSIYGQDKPHTVYLTYNQLHKDSEHELSHVNEDEGIHIKYILDELNEARANPVVYGKSIDVDLSLFKPMEALSLVEDLSLNAKWYSQRLFDMAPVFEHSHFLFKESILWNYDVCSSVSQFIIDEGVPDLGHRKHMLNRTQTKVGIGVTSGFIGGWHRTYVVILTK